MKLEELREKYNPPAVEPETLALLTNEDKTFALRRFPTGEFVIRRARLKKVTFVILPATVAKDIAKRIIKETRNDSKEA